MQANFRSKFKWFEVAAAGTEIGMAVGAVFGLVIGGGAGGWFWYSMATDGFNAFSDDTEALFGFVLTVGLSIGGFVVGLCGGGILGFAMSGIFSAITASSKSR